MPITEKRDEALYCAKNLFQVSKIGDSKMKRCLIMICLVMAWMLAVQSALPQTTENQSKFGIGLNAGVQKPFCDVLHTGLGPAGEFMMRFLVSNRFNLSMGIGYGLLNDGFTKNTFETNLITGDLKANINLLAPGRVNPYLTVGLGVFSFEYKQTESYAIGLPTLQGQRYFDGALIVGGGMEIMTSPKFALNLFADYRHTTGDALDGFDFGNKDGYLNVRGGFTYYMSKRPLGAMPEGEDLLAMQNREFGESNQSAPEDSQNLAMFEAKIDKLEAAESEFNMEQYVRLKSRVDELNVLIDEKEKELEELRATLELKDQRITTLESSLQRTTTTGSSGDFSDLYESALRNYYSRSFQAAIDLFQDLQNRFPNHNLASNCQYWIGECYFGLNDYVHAAEAFQAVFNYSISYKKDDATLMLGRCYFNMNDLARSRSYFQGVINDYPDSEYIEKAKQWLTRIG